MWGVVFQIYDTPCAPATGLVKALCNKVGGKVCLKQLLVLKWVMKLCVCVYMCVRV